MIFLHQCSLVSEYAWKVNDCWTSVIPWVLILIGSHSNHIQLGRRNKVSSIVQALREGCSNLSVRRQLSLLILGCLWDRKKDLFNLQIQAWLISIGSGNPQGYIQREKEEGWGQDKEGQPCLKGSRRKGPLLAEKEPRTRAGQKAKSVTEKKAHHGITLQRKTRKNEECTAAKGFGTWKGTPSSPLRCTFYEGMRDTALQWLQEWVKGRHVETTNRPAFLAMEQWRGLRAAQDCWPLACDDERNGVDWTRAHYRTSENTFNRQMN